MWVLSVASQVGGYVCDCHPAQRFSVGSGHLGLFV